MKAKSLLMVGLLLLVGGQLNAETTRYSDDSTFEFSDTTWPLRLAGDSTWPLRFNGGASSGAESVDAKITIGRISNQPSRVSINCKINAADTQRHSANGLVAISSAKYAILGICYSPSSNTLEVVSKNQGGTISSLVSRMPPASTTKMRGHLYVKNKVYNVSVKCNARIASE